MLVGADVGADVGANVGADVGALVVAAVHVELQSNAVCVPLALATQRPVVWLH